jgi:RNA methyltransferase, TrmH family
VLGNEARGVRKEILQLASQRIRIDIEDMESLNVAIAGGIAMYSLSRLVSQKD